MIYLDNAATSFPKPQCMIQEMFDCLKNYCGNPGRSGHAMSMKTAEKIYGTRQALAELFHFEDPSKILFTSNTTEALNLAIKGILLPGDHVITTTMEHNSVLRPLLSQKNISVTIVSADEQGRVRPEEIQREIRENTKLIICTHSSNVVGTILPIREIGKIARDHSVYFLVDAAQSAGALPIDFRDLSVDMMAFAGHKSLLGPQGTGFLYVNRTIDLTPLKDGGTGTQSKNTTQPHDYPEGYEAGTVNAPGIIGLGASIRFLNQVGVETIHKREAELTHFLYSELKNMNQVIVYGCDSPWEKTGVVSFNLLNRESEEVAALLNRHFHIACRAGFHCAPYAHETIGSGNGGTVRLSLGCFTKPKEIKYAINSIYQISTGKII